MRRKEKPLKEVSKTLKGIRAEMELNVTAYNKYQQARTPFMDYHALMAYVHPTDRIYFTARLKLIGIIL